MGDAAGRERPALGKRVADAVALLGQEGRGPHTAATNQMKARAKGKTTTNKSRSLAARKKPAPPPVASQRTSPKRAVTPGRTLESQEATWGGRALDPTEI